MTGGLHQRARVMAHVEHELRTGLSVPQIAPAEELQADFDAAPPTPREVLATVGWRRIAVAALFATAVWIGTAAFAVMCGGPQ